MLDAGLAMEFINQRNLITLLSIKKGRIPVDVPESLLDQCDKNYGFNRLYHGIWACPQSTTITSGAGDIVELLLRKGSPINKALGDIRFWPSDSPYQERRGYRRPTHIPIFAAAAYMGRTGSTHMMDTFLRHGAQINCLAPENMSPHYAACCCATSPFLMYLESIPSFSTEAEHLPRDGIEYLIRNGAHMSLSDIRRASWETIWGTFTHDLPGVLSPVQLLLSKWRLRTLHWPRYFGTIKLLIQRGSELTRVANIIHNFSHDSHVTSVPLRQRRLDHPDHVPQWWSIVNLLLRLVTTPRLLEVEN